MSVKKVYIVEGSADYFDMFLEEGFELVHGITDADLICFTGGEDVSPELYGESTHKKTYSNARRDSVEKEIFLAALDRKIPMVGICRGGQFLNVMSGGKMYQHVTGHTMNHNMFDVMSGHVILCSSTHHQMMRPSAKAELIAYAQQPGIREHCPTANGTTTVVANNNMKDAEVVWYAHSHCLCFQPHPEFRSPIYEGLRSYFFNTLSRLIP